MQTIGFANEYYTLWNVTTEMEYFTDSNGKHWPTREKIYYNYVKNISKDLNRAKELYPGVPVDENLRGKRWSFSIYGKEEDLSPEVLKFGKYRGELISDVVKTDLKYILWLCDSGYPATKKVCLELPEIKEYFAGIKRKEEEELAAIDTIKENGIIELEFSTNPSAAAADYLAANLGLSKDESPYVVAWAKFGNNTRIAVSFGENQVNRVDGMYPYFTAMMGGKFKRIKGKAFKVNVEVVDTVKLQGITQVVILK